VTGEEAEEEGWLNAVGDRAELIDIFKKGLVEPVAEVEGLSWLRDAGARLRKP